MFWSLAKERGSYLEILFERFLPSYRFILANTEQLHSKIHEMSEHIRRLEEALQSSSSSSDAHPLLQPDMLNVKSTMELYGVTQPKNGSTSTPVSSERAFDHELGDDDSKWSGLMSSVAAVRAAVQFCHCDFLILYRANDATTY